MLAAVNDADNCKVVNVNSIDDEMGAIGVESYWRINLSALSSDLRMAA